MEFACLNHLSFYTVNTISKIIIIIISAYKVLYGDWPFYYILYQRTASTADRVKYDSKYNIGMRYKSIIENATPGPFLREWSRRQKLAVYKMLINLDSG